MPEAASQAASRSASRAWSRVDAVLGERIVRHGFVGRPAKTVAGAAALTGGIQAQDAAAARLGIRARAATLTEADVLAAVERREVVRTWLMRNTIHLVPAVDVRWMTALLAPMITRRFETVRWPQLGLTPAVLAEIEAAAPEILAGRALTRAEFAAALAERGRPLAADPQAAGHALLYLSTIGLVCRGLERGRDSEFVLLDDWLPDSAVGPRGDDALAQFARRFFAAFSPATAADFTTWSGLSSGRAIELIRDELTPADVHGRAGFRLGEVAPGSGVRLLSAFDNYLIGYRDREAIIAPDRRGDVYVGGIIRPALLIHGRVAGRWQLARRTTRSGDRNVITLWPYVTLSPRLRRAIEAEVDDLARFTGRPGELTVPA